MWKQSGIYAIWNIVSGMVYIGETEKTFAKRWEQHRRDLDYGQCCTAALQADWLEYGASAFEFEILEVIPAGSPAELFLVRERHYMSLYLDRLYNRNGRKSFGRYTNTHRYLKKQH